MLSNFPGPGTSIGLPNMAPILPIFDVEECFRLITELSNALDAYHKTITSYRQTLEPEVMAIKTQLLEQITNFFTYFHTVDYLNIEYAKKCEELLWRIYFYQNYRLYSLHASVSGENNSHLFKQFIISGLGTYYSLFFNLQATFNLKELNFVSYFRSMPLEANSFSNSDDFLFCNGFDCKQYDFGRNQKEEFKSLLIYLSARFFTCIGDLSRYLIACFPEDRSRDYFHENAVFFYKCATIIEPGNGMAHNQLGTLARDEFYGLHSLYYYFRSLKCKAPFMMASQNITRMFDNVKSVDPKRFLTARSSQQLTERSIHAFLSFFTFVYQSRKSSKFSFGNEYQCMMRNTVEKIMKTISVQKVKGPTSKFIPEHLSSENLLRIVSLVYIQIDDYLKEIVKKKIVYNAERYRKFQTGSFETQDKVPFLMNVLIQFLLELLTKIVAYEKHKLEKFLPKIIAYEESRDALSRDLSQIDSFQFKTPRKGQRTRSGTSFSSETIDEDSQTINSLKSTAINSIVDLFEHTEVDHFGTDFDRFSTISEDDEDDEDSDQSHEDSENNMIPRDVRNITSLLDGLYNHSFMPVIKLFCDIFESNRYFLRFAGYCDQFEQFFRQFYDYINLLSEFDYKLITGFNHLYCGVPLEFKSESWNAYAAFVAAQRKVPITEFSAKYPPGFIAEYLNLTRGTQMFYEREFKLNNGANLDDFYRHLSRASTETMSHSCMRSLLKFGLDFAGKPEKGRAFEVTCEEINHCFEQRAPMCFIVEPNK